MWALYILSVDIGTSGLSQSQGPYPFLLDRKWCQVVYVVNGKRPQHRSLCRFCYKKLLACPLFSASPQHHLGHRFALHTSFFVTGRPYLFLLLLMMLSYLSAAWRFSFNRPWKFKDTISLAIRKSLDPRKPRFD